MMRGSTAPLRQVMLRTVSPSLSLEERFTAFVENRPYPCVGAKSALARGQMTIVMARDIGSAQNDATLYRAIREFAGLARGAADAFQSLVVVFEGPVDLSEAALETALWRRLQALSDIDVRQGQACDPHVSADPESPEFSLSFGGEAFFVIGLHPGASRRARRFDTPVIVFNPHRQFRRLRDAGRYEGLRRAIVARDLAFSGSANPMLARHGERSEARQYSGRVVDQAWVCPFTGRGGASHGS